MLSRTVMLACASTGMASTARCEVSSAHAHTPATCIKSSAGPYLVKNYNELNQKMGAMKKAGASRLQIVTDFDFTLTKFYQANMGRAFSCHKCIEDCGYLSESYHDKAQALQRKYYPLEGTAHLSFPPPKPPRFRRTNPTLFAWQWTLP